MAYIGKGVIGVEHPSTSALTATSVTSTGAVSGTTGTFSSAVSGTTGTFTNNVVMTSDDPTITMTDSSGTNDIATIQATSGALIVTARDGSADGEIIFKKTDGSATDETMRINSSGTLLVGTTDTSPFNNTSTTGTTIAAGELQLASVNGEAAYFNRSGSNGRVINIRRAGSFVGGIDVSTSQVTYNQTSDYRLKENVSYTWDATARLKQLKPARFNYIVDPDNIVDGFLAHEVSEACPSAITGEKDAVDSDGNIDPQCIDHSKLVPLLVKTIQELEARITALESA